MNLSDTESARRLAPLAECAPGKLMIHEIYQSIQGESLFAGYPCVFVRLAACHLRCRWCDTPHAFHHGTEMSLQEILDRVGSFPAPFVEVTGGEPLLQPEVHGLMQMIHELGRRVLLETSGAISIEQVPESVHIVMDLKCPGSDECSSNRYENVEYLKRTDEIKFVVSDRSDFDWLTEIIKRYELDRKAQLMVSPVHGEVSLTELAEWIIASELSIRLQSQLHKEIWPTATRGV